MANVLWTDIIDPSEASAIAREEQYDIERRRGGTLARFLPNVLHPSDHVKFFPGQSGLVDAARYRAFNSPPAVGKGQGTKGSTIDLPAISRTEPLDEMTQKELARLSDDRIRKGLSSAIKRNTQAISQRQEVARGSVIHSGALIIDEDDFEIGDIFGRDPALTVAAGSGQWWNDPTVDRLSALNGWADIYAGKNNGLLPGRMVFGGRNVYRALSSGNQFRTVVGTGTRPPQRDEVEGYLMSEELPEFEVYERNVSLDGVLTRVLSPKHVYFLPEPVDPDTEEGSLLGATYWGKTVSSTFASWEIEEDEQPGIVCGVFRDDQVGASVEVQGDSIGEPVLANPNACMAIQVLP